MFDQYVLNVKLLGYLINLLQDAKQGPVINVSASLLNMYKYANMQHSTNFWTDWCEVRLEICIALFLLQSCGDILVHKQNSNHFNLEQYCICIFSFLFSF